jgi:hypothetical protein
MPIVSTFRNHPSIGNVIVVVDNITEDNTWDYAASVGAICVTGTHARGKGQCMQYGLTFVTTERVVFCDADLYGFAYDHVSHLTHPTTGMILGVPDFPTLVELETTGQPAKWRRRLTFSWAMVTGQRSVPATFARTIPLHGYLAETQLNMEAVRQGLEITPCDLRGLHSPFMLTDRRLAAMEVDRRWGQENGWLPQNGR